MARNFRPLFVGLFSICVLLTACVDQKAIMKGIVPPQDDALARQFIESIRLGDFDKAKAELDPSVSEAGADDAFHKIHDLLAKGNVVEIEVVGCNITTMDGKHRSDLSYQIQFPNSWAFGDVVVDTTNGTRTVAGIHFNVSTESLETLNRFSLGNKSLLHYFVFTCCVAVPIFIIYTLIICIRTRVRQKWLWIIFILLGVMQFDLNWTTGQWDFKPLSIVLLGTGYRAAGPYAPWVLNFGLPLGACVFLANRKRLQVPPIRTSS